MADTALRDEIKDLVKRHGLPPYIYTDPDRFTPGKTPVLYSGLYWNADEIVNAVEAIIAGTWVAYGDKVRQFEEAFASKICDRYVVMVNSGSSANLILIAACKQVYGWDDCAEIIVSPVGFPTTIAPIPQNNLTPVIVDIEMDTLNIDIDRIEAKITDKTVAVFLSPVLGNPPDMDKLTALCKRRGLLLLLDACDSLGSTWRGNYLNSYAAVSSHSFYASHIISTGQGGAITTNNADIATAARQLSTWGRACCCSDSQALSQNGACGKRFAKWLDNYDGIIDHKYVFDYMGYNLRGLDLQGAIGLVQLEKMDEIFIRRKTSKRILQSLFEDYVSDVRIVDSLYHADPVWFGTPVICQNKDLKDRLVQHLENNLIQTRNYFAGNLLLHKGYEDLGNWQDYPNANSVLETVFFIGAAPFYRAAHFDYAKGVLMGFKNA